MRRFWNVSFFLPEKTSFSQNKIPAAVDFTGVAGMVTSQKQVRLFLLQKLLEQVIFNICDMLAEEVWIAVFP